MISSDSTSQWNIEPGQPYKVQVDYPKNEYKEVFEPNVISNIALTRLCNYGIEINYANNTVKSTTISAGDKISVSFIKDGTIYNDIVGTLKEVIHTNPTYTLSIDSSEEFESKVILVPILSIRDICNLSYPDNDRYKTNAELGEYGSPTQNQSNKILLVDVLPTDDIKTNAIYIIYSEKVAEYGGGNGYVSYLYDATKSNWVKIGFLPDKSSSSNNSGENPTT